jgi:hypothetical protein
LQRTYHAELSQSTGRDAIQAEKCPTLAEKCGEVRAC